MQRRLELTKRAALVTAVAFVQPTTQPDKAEARPLQSVTHGLPIRFEPNVGQWSDDVRFVGRGTGVPAVIRDDGVTVGTTSFRLLGFTARPHGDGELSTRSNFFIGSTRERWRTNVPNYALVRASDAAAGVDMVWHGEHALEYDLSLAAGVDPRGLTVEVDGPDRVALTADGSIEVTTREGKLIQHAPHVTQGGRELPARFARKDATHFTFAIEGYDVTAASLIDPIFSYSSYLGGSGFDKLYALAVDASGYIYVAGVTGSTDFPTKDAWQAANAGASDAFICKLTPSGSALVYSTYLGGSSGEQANGMAIDASGNVYAVGTTQSTDFPTTSAFQAANAGKHDAFVTLLDSSGSKLTYSSYLGGSGDDYGMAIAPGSSKNAYVTGYTASTDFPTSTTAIQSANAGGGTDAFVASVSGTGALSYATYLGGTDFDHGYGIAVDGSGDAYVAGDTASADFPTASPFQAANGNGGGSFTGFVSELSSTGTALTYSTYLGGSTTDSARAIVVDGSGDAYVTGYTASSDFPIVSGALQSKIAGSEDAFISKLNPGATKLLYSTFLGGADSDQALALVVDDTGAAIVGGYTVSKDFPLQNATQASNAGQIDAFVARVAPSGAPLLYSTYLGGSANDYGEGVAFDPSNNIWVAGYTLSTDFPTANAFQSASGGGYDAFVTEVTAPNQALGTPCGAHGACASNTCVDGVCCDGVCGGSCEACDVTGYIGTCVLVTGAPHGMRPPCLGTGVCAGVCTGADSMCAYPAPTVACGSACTSDNHEVDSLCNGHGGCAEQPAQACSSLGCAGGKCKTVCTASNDCALGLVCIDGTCEPPPTCATSHIAKASDGGVTDCIPYNCDDASAQCLTTCATTSDCVVGWACMNGSCALPPYASGGGCSCDLATSTSSNDVVVAWIVLLGTLWARRRLA